MSRPTPTISSPNEYDAYFRQAQQFAERFAGCEGVVGVLLTGGVARGYADHCSELDLAVYLTRPQFNDWTCRGLALFPEGDFCLDGWQVDFDYFCYEDEMETEWEHTKRWDRSYDVVLHDPQGLMGEILARKAILTEEEKQRLTSHHLVLYGEYFCNLVVPSWLHRGDLLAAHHCLNTTLDSLIKAVFLANDELIPFDKWTLNLSYTLPWTPRDWRGGEVVWCLPLRCDGISRGRLHRGYRFSRGSQRNVERQREVSTERPPRDSRPGLPSTRRGVHV
jgi:hypothetical protein